MRVVSVPTAPRLYVQSEEQIFRDHVRRDIQNSVARDSLFHPTTNLPLFFGQPHAQVLGTNATMSVAASTMTYLPLPTVVMSHPNLVSGAEIKTAYPMDVEIQASVYHPAPGGAARKARYELYVSRWDGASYISDVLVGVTTMDFADGWTINFGGMLASLGYYLRLRLFHNDSASNTFDLTKSWFNIKQLGIDPLTTGTRML